MRRSSVKGNKKLRRLIPFLVFFLVLLSGLCIFFFLEMTAAEERAEEYKAAYEALVEDTRKAKQADAEAKKAAEDWQVAYNQLVSDMLDDAVLAEKMGNLIVSVWHNAIWKTEDEETDPFTRENGVFVSDFNDALRNLFNSEEFSNHSSILSANQYQVRKQMKEMLHPPEGYENAMKALENLYNSYLSFTNIVLRCNGSLESFSNDFGSADKEFNNYYLGAELYAK